MPEWGLRGLPLFYGVGSQLIIPPFLLGYKRTNNNKKNNNNKKKNKCERIVRNITKNLKQVGSVESGPKGPISSWDSLTWPFGRGH